MGYLQMFRGEISLTEHSVALRTFPVRFQMRLGVSKRIAQKDISMTESALYNLEFYIDRRRGDGQHLLPLLLHFLGRS